VRTNVSPFRFVLCALVALSLWGAPAFSQHPEHGGDTEADHHVGHVGAIHDWTHDHTLYPRVGPMNRLIALQNDRRAIQHWEESYRKDYARWRGGEGEGEGHRSHHHNQSSMKRDWAIFTGGTVGGTLFSGSSNNSAYSAKWTFDINENLTGASANTGACASDYLVAPVNTISAGVSTTGIGQPDIVGLNNLYSGPAGPPVPPTGTTGICNRGTPAATDDGVSATVLFSYAIIADDGLVTTSPVTSFDGNLIAFVEVGSVGGTAHFHVLHWNAGDGANPLHDQDVSTFLTAPITTFVSSPPAAGQVTDLPLTTTVGTGLDSISSPYVEYSDDVAYVGNDGGMIFKIKNVFCPTWAPCNGSVPPPPSLDTTFGTGGSIQLPCTGMVSGITVDGSGGNIFAGCSDGFLYEISPTGTVLSSLQIGDGNGTNGGIVDAPTLDEVNGWVYVETGSCVSTLTGCTTGGVGFGAPALVQASMSNLATPSAAYLGPFTGVPTDVNPVNVHAPAFNDAYFTSPSSGNWILYDYASDNGNGGEIVLYGVTFNVATAPNSAHIMDSGAPPNALNFAIGASEVSPLTEFFTTGGEDRLFAGNLVATPGNVVSFNITSGFPAATEFSNFPDTYGTGTSGIVADNVASTFGQANSIYFGVQGTAGTAFDSVVKLTQSALQ